MFPDVYEEENTGVEPSAVGIVIADDTPFNIEGKKKKHSFQHTNYSYQKFDIL